MTNPRTWEWWVMKVVPKHYKSRLSKTETGKWQAGSQYLSPESKEFEKMVRNCAEAAGVEPLEWVKLRIWLYWPANFDKKRKIWYPLAGRPDASNVQKSCEDGVQKQKVRRSWYNRARECERKIAAAEMNPMINGADWECKLASINAQIAEFKATEALRGCVIPNDRETLDIHTTVHWRAPNTAKCVRIRAIEIWPEHYETQELKEWRLKH